MQVIKTANESHQLNEPSDIQTNELKINRERHG